MSPIRHTTRIADRFGFLRSASTPSSGTPQHSISINRKVSYDLYRCITFFIVVYLGQMPSKGRTRLPAALPTAAELDILAVLWRLRAATVREVHNELGKDISYTTTLKQMQLMTEKGLLTRGERFGAHVYEAGAP